MKKKLLIAAALLLVAAVGAYFCWPVRLLPDGEDLGELEITYLEHSAEDGELSGISERYRLTPDMPEYAEVLELLQMSRCHPKLGTFLGRGSIGGAYRLMTVYVSTGDSVMLTEVGEVSVNGRVYRCQAKPLLYAIRGLLASVPQLTV